MSEHLGAQEWVVQPELGEVKVSSETGFVYIMREDGDYTMAPIAQRLAAEHGADPTFLSGALLYAYEHFFGELSAALHWTHASRGNFQLHVFAAGALEQAVRAVAGNSPIVSMDPLLRDGVWPLRISRGYYLGGERDFGQVARPGSPSLDEQVAAIATALQGIPVVLGEDDVFTAGSAGRSLGLLEAGGIKIASVAAGVQVGPVKHLGSQGTPVEAAVHYTSGNGSDIFDQVDLGDPRDFIVGASGLVVLLPSGSLGRAPYLLPFVSAAARAGIPMDLEREFSCRVLQANLAFFTEVEATTGLTVLLGHMDTAFGTFMAELFGFGADTPMTEIVVWSLENMDSIWEHVRTLGQQQALAARSCVK